MFAGPVFHPRSSGHDSAPHNPRDLAQGPFFLIQTLVEVHESNFTKLSSIQSPQLWLLARHDLSSTERPTLRSRGPRQSLGRPAEPGRSLLRRLARGTPPHQRLGRAAACC
jgi:hypothetical protein